METLRIRCPGCQKLYGVDPSLIKDPRPEFGCRQCGIKFWIEFPPREPGEVVGTLKAAIEPNDASPYPKPSRPPPNLENKFSCPKCKFNNEKGSISCASCGVIFEKLEKRGKPTPADIGATDDLRLQWEKVLTHYQSVEEHERFLRECLAVKQLPFASQQYRRMIDLNASDPIALKMRDKIIEMATLTYIPPRRPEPMPAKSSISMLIAIGGLFVGIIGMFIPKIQIFSRLGFVAAIAGGAFYVIQYMKAQGR